MFESNRSDRERRWPRLLLLLGLLLCGFLQAEPAGAEEPSACLGEISGVAVVGEELLAGTRAGLFVLAEPGADLRRVEGLPRQPVLSLAREGGDLRLAFGDFSSLRLAGWDPRVGRFGTVEAAPRVSPVAGRDRHQGFLVTATAEVAGERLVGTLGGGLFRGPDRMAGSPERVTALTPWRGGLAVGTPEGLVYWEPQQGTFDSLFQNPAADCRITALAGRQGRVVAGTLGGGLLAWPGYESIGPSSGLAARVNGLAAAGEGLFVGTEAGMASWDGSVWRLRQEITEESVKALAALRGFVYFTTPAGLKRFHPGTGQVTHLSTATGAFMSAFAGDLYLGGMFGVWHVDLTGRFGVRRILHENVTGMAALDGKLYASGYYGGLWELTPLPRKVSEGQFSCIAAGGGRLWLGTGHQGVLSVRSVDDDPPQPVAPFWPADTITALLVQGEMLIVGTPAGIAGAPLPP